MEPETRMPMVILVEDSPADTYIIRESLKRYVKDFELRVLEDGEKAIRFVDALESDEELPCPSIWLLDLNLPRRSGHEVLQRIKRSRCAHVPVVVVTSSDSPADRAATTKMGATAYFCKPVDLDAFLTVGELVQRLIGSQD